MALGCCCCQACGECLSCALGAHAAFSLRETCFGRSCLLERDGRPHHNHLWDGFMSCTGIIIGRSWLHRTREHMQHGVPFRAANWQRVTPRAAHAARVAQVHRLGSAARPFARPVDDDALQHRRSGERRNGCAPSHVTCDVLCWGCKCITCRRLCLCACLCGPPRFCPPPPAIMPASAHMPQRCLSTSACLPACAHTLNACTCRPNAQLAYGVAHGPVRTPPWCRPPLSPLLSSPAVA